MTTVCNNIRGARKTEVDPGAGPDDISRITELIDQAAGGNFKAFGEIYNMYLDRIYRYVFYQVNDSMTAEDITEEVFLKAWKAIGTCKGKEKTFLSWLYRIAHNQLINTLRDNNRITSLEKDISREFADSKQEIDTSTDCHELLETISYLPENQKQIIILKFIEGLDNREISKIIGKKEGAIRISQMRALATIREKFLRGAENHGRQIGEIPGLLP
jgi:RNA polymerase sigma-70 factor (ECF subfamily)